MCQHFAGHETVHHSSGEYVRSTVNRFGSIEKVHTNSAEGYFDLQARQEGHLPALRREASAPVFGRIRFRYNHRVALGIGDIDPTLAAFRGIAGKRLYFKQPDRA